MLIQLYPEKWAGAVISAFDNFTEPNTLTHVPVLVFQGDADRSVPVNLVREMMKQLKKMHANFRYTEYHGVDHEGQHSPAQQSQGPQSRQAGQVGSSAPPGNP